MRSIYLVYSSHVRSHCSGYLFGIFDSLDKCKEYVSNKFSLSVDTNNINDILLQKRSYEIEYQKYDSNIGFSTAQISSDCIYIVEGTGTPGMIYSVYDNEVDAINSIVNNYNDIIENVYNRPSKNKIDQNSFVFTNCDRSIENGIITATSNDFGFAVYSERILKVELK